MNLLKVIRNRKNASHKKKGVPFRSKSSKSKSLLEAPSIQPALTATLSEDEGVYADDSSTIKSTEASSSYTQIVTEETAVNSNTIRFLQFTEEQVLQNELNHIREIRTRDHLLNHKDAVIEEMKKVHAEALEGKKKELENTREELTRVKEELRNSEDVKKPQLEDEQTYILALQATEIELEETKRELEDTKEKLAEVGSKLIQCQHELHEKKSDKWWFQKFDTVFA